MRKKPPFLVGGDMIWDVLGRRTGGGVQERYKRELWRESGEKSGKWQDPGWRGGQGSR